MKQNKHILLLFICATCCLYSCKSDVDLNNIDGKAEIDFGLGLPVGNLSATLGDFLGGELSKNIFIDQEENKGVLTYRDTFSITRDFHKIDLTRYLSNATKDFSIRNAVSTSPIIGNGKSVLLEFPFTMKLNNVNNDLSDERIDSIIVTSAEFINKFGTSNLSSDFFDWTERIELGLGKEFYCKSGNKRITLYDRMQQSGQYDFDSIPKQVDNFSICLMKDRNQIGEVTDEVSFKLYLTLNVPNGKSLPIPDNASLNYELSLNFLTYDAIWGMFAPSKDMYDEDVMVISEQWQGWNKLRQAKLPFAQPKIDMQVSTQIAGHLILEGEYLYAESDETGNRVYATFDEADTHNYTHVVPDRNILSLTSMTGSYMVDNILFNHETDKGRIDRMFAIRPDKIGYKFGIDFYNRKEYPQGRLTNNTNVTIDAITTLPFIFNQGVEISYSDTLMNIEIDTASLDAEPSTPEIIDTVKDANIKLVLVAQNTIPLAIRGHFRFLDADGNELTITDEKGNAEPLQLTADTLRFEAPTFGKVDGKTVITKPGESTIIVSIDKQRYDAVKRLSSIILDATIDDQAIQQAQAKNPDLSIYPIQVTEDNTLKIHIGLAADMEGVVDFTQVINNDSKED